MSILKLSLSQILIGLLAGGTVFTFLALPTKVNAINEYNRAKAMPTEGIASLEVEVQFTPPERGETGRREGGGTR